MHLQLFIFLNPKFNKIEEIRLCLCLFPLIVYAVDFGVKLLYFEDADPSAYRKVDEVLIGESLVSA